MSGFEWAFNSFLFFICLVHHSFFTIKYYPNIYRFFFYSWICLPNILHVLPCPLFLVSKLHPHSQTYKLSNMEYMFLCNHCNSPLLHVLNISLEYCGILDVILRFEFVPLPPSWDFFLVEFYVLFFQFCCGFFEEFE